MHVLGSEEAVLAGWCETCHERKMTGESSILPSVARTYPGRVEILKELTASAKPGCTGCFGFVPASMELESTEPREEGA